MKKIFTLIAMAAMAISANAQTDATVNWVVTSDGEKAVITPSATPSEAATAVAPTVGEGLSILEASKTWSDITFLQVQPTISDKGNNKYASCSDLKKYIDFKFTAAKEFTVKEVSFDIIKIGTGDPNIYIAIIDNDNKETLIAGGDASVESSATVIRRNNDDDTSISINQKHMASAVVAEGKAFTLRIYVGKLANNKQVGIGNIVISGTVPGTNGINSVKVANESNAIYNLAGQQVTEAYKGVVVKNGKKMIQK